LPGHARKTADPIHQVADRGSLNIVAAITQFIPPGTCTIRPLCHARSLSPHLVGSYQARSAVEQFAHPRDLAELRRGRPRPDDAPVTTAHRDAMRTAFLVEGNPLCSRNGREIDLPVSEAHVDHAVHAAAAVRLRRYRAAPQLDAP